MTRFATVREGMAIEGAVGDPGGRSPWRVNHVVTGVLAACALMLGIVLGRVTDDVDDVVPAAQIAASEAAIDEPEVQVAGAVEIRSGELAPTATDHLLVVAVSANTCGERASGTGVLIAPDLVLTAAHVVGDAGLVRIDHQGVVLTAEVVGVFEDGRDLALVTLPAPLDSPVPVGSTPTLGQTVTMVGHPGGGAITSIVGSVVDVPSQASIVLRGDLLAVGADAPTGMSGGPAVNDAGDVVGIVVAAQPGTGTAIVVTFEDVKELLDAALIDGRCPEVA